MSAYNPSSFKSSSCVPSSATFPSFKKIILLSLLRIVPNPELLGYYFLLLYLENEQNGEHKRIIRNLEEDTSIARFFAALYIRILGKELRKRTQIDDRHYNSVIKTAKKFQWLE